MYEDHKFLSNHFLNLLIKEIERVSNEKFVIYKPICHTLNEKQNPKLYENHCVCFRPFEDYYHYMYHELKNNQYSETYDYFPDQKFNYYLLIRANFYKTFKKLKLDANCNYICYNHTWKCDNLNDIFPDIAKFIQGTYSKKKFNYNGTNYIRLKLRAFSNTFIPQVCLTFWDESKKKLYDNERNKNDILLMIKPVKKKYSKLIILDNHSLRNFKDEIIINDKLTLKYNQISSLYTVAHINSERIEHILDQILEKELHESCSDDNDLTACIYDEETNKDFEVELIEFYKNL